MHRQINPTLHMPPNGKCGEVRAMQVSGIQGPCEGRRKAGIAQNYDAPAVFDGEQGGTMRELM